VQITYDIYKPYLHKAASSRELLLVSRVSVAFFGLVMACVSVIFYKVFLLTPQSCVCMLACCIASNQWLLCQWMHFYFFIYFFGQLMHAAAELCPDRHMDAVAHANEPKSA